MRASEGDERWRSISVVEEYMGILPFQIQIQCQLLLGPRTAAVFGGYIIYV